MLQHISWCNIWLSLSVPHYPLSLKAYSLWLKVMGIIYIYIYIYCLVNLNLHLMAVCGMDFAAFFFLDWEWCDDVLSKNKRKNIMGLLRLIFRNPTSSVFVPPLHLQNSMTLDSDSDEHRDERQTLGDICQTEDWPKLVLLQIIHSFPSLCRVAFGVFSTGNKVKLWWWEAVWSNCGLFQVGTFKPEYSY